MRKSLIYTILAAFVLLSCGREPLPDSPGEGTGELLIRIAAPMSSGTKAGTAADGDVMNNLHIWLVDSTEKVVRYAFLATNKHEQCSQSIRVNCSPLPVSILILKYPCSDK